MLKIAIANPPLAGPGVPLLSQNRQFQWYRSSLGAYHIFPVVSGYAATLLAKEGFNVIWLDAVAENKTFAQFLDSLKKEKPDILAIETKTPVVKKHWLIVNDLKKKFPRLKVVLMGDHVTALPKESFEMSAVDFVLSGGDFDFLLLSLAKFLSGQEKMLEKGIFYRGKKGKTILEGQKRQFHNLQTLPIIDRKFTKWRLYSGDNGNFKYQPNAYTMIGRDCWWRRPSSKGKAGCTFCSWTTTFPTWRVGKPERLLDEIEGLISLGVKEVFDDTGTFPIGDWLKSFCGGMIQRGYHKKIIFGCNMRAGALKKEDFQLMKKANFRFILYGLESASQKTIDKLNKGTTPSSLKNSLKMAKQAGLEPHVTIMFGYPWETKKEAEKTVAFAHELYKEGCLNTLQATLLIPYPGTALYDQAKENGWLLTEDYDKYDMSQPVLKTALSESELKSLVQRCYHSFWSFEFIARKLLEIRSLKDFSFLFFNATKYFSKLLDFKPEAEK